MQSTPPKRYQQLQPEDRVTLARLTQQRYSIRAMAQVLGIPQAPSAVSCAQRRYLQGRTPGELHRDGILFGLMRHFLQKRWSPEQLALTLARIFPKGHEHRVSHETIYNWICAQPLGELKRELIATLRHAHKKRVPRSKGQD